MQTIKLIDVCEFVRNGANIKQLSNETRGIPITRIETLANDRFNRLGYANITDDSFSDYYLKRGDVLLSHINGAKFIGRSVMYEPEEGETIIHGMNLLCLRFKSNYNPKFFCYYAKSKAAKNYFDKHTKKAVNQASITSTDIKNMPIPNLPIEQQNAIVNVFDSLFERMDYLTKQTDLFEELIKSKFNEMFLENDYPIKTIGEVAARITKGSTPTTYGFDFKKEGINFVKIESIDESHRFLLNKFAFIGQDCYDAFKRSQLEEGDVLFSIAGALGRTAIVTKEILPANTNQALAIIKLQPNCNILKPFLLYEFESQFVIEQIEKDTVGAAQKNLSLQNISDLKIKVPSLSEQTRFQEFAEIAQKLIQDTKKDHIATSELLEKKLSDYFFEYEED